MRLPRFSWSFVIPLAVAACDDKAASSVDTGYPPPDVAALDVVSTDAPTADAPTADAPTDAGPRDAAPDATDATAPTDVPTGDVPAGDVPAADVTDAGAADAGAGCALDRVLVTTTDFMTGGYALGPRAMGSLMAVGGMAPDQDHVPVQSGCVVYNLLRGNDILAVLDNANLPTIARRIPLRGQLPDAGAAPYQVNPYDVLTLSPTRAYVVQFAMPRIAVVDPTRDGAAAITGSIDLSPLRSAIDMDANGSPEPVRVVRAGGRALVALQNLSAFAPVANGTLAVIDTATDALVDVDPMTNGIQGVTLSARNPASMTLSPSGARAVVASVGVQAFTAPQTLDGAIEAIDAMTLRPTGMRITEMSLGGDVGAVAMLDDDRGWVVVSRLASDAGPGDERIVEFNLATGAVGRTVFTARSIAALARDPDGNIWVVDRSAGSEAVRVFAPDGTQRTPALTTGSRPPFGIAFVP